MRNQAASGKTAEHQEESFVNALTARFLARDLLSIDIFALLEKRSLRARPASLPAFGTDQPMPFRKM